MSAPRELGRTDVLDESDIEARALGKAIARVRALKLDTTYDDRWDKGYNSALEDAIKAIAGAGK